MTTEHLGAWEDKHELVFQKTSQEVKKFQFTKGGTAGGTLKTDELLWRNWNITWAIRYAIKFSKSKNYNFIEVGVADGISSFYALHEIEKHKISEYKMHLMILGVK